MRALHFLFLAAAVVLVATPAYAQSETDRLREALRSATAQSRSLQDLRAALQAKLTAAELERDRLRKQNDAFKAQVKEAEQAYRQAVKDFNDRLGERDEALEKWRSAYGEAAGVARAKEAERARLDGETTALKASTKACEARNVRLVKVADDILIKFEAMSPFEKLTVHDPVFGLRRVEHQNAVQDLRDQILDQKNKQ